MNLNSTQKLTNASSLIESKSSPTGRIDFTAMLKDTIAAHYNLVKNSMEGVTSPTLTHHTTAPQQSDLRLILGERALGARAYGKALMPSNIANTKTPGYQPVDVGISDATRTGKT